MIVAVSVYRARRGEDLAVVDLYRHRDAHPDAKDNGLISSELLRSLADPQVFISIDRYGSGEQARVDLDEDHSDWYRRLVGLIGAAPVHVLYETELRVPDRVDRLEVAP